MHGNTVPPFPNTSKHSTIGALNIGICVALVLCGITLQQVASYYRQYPHDRKLIKVIVAILTIFNLIHSGFIMHISYFWSIHTWGAKHNQKSLKEDLPTSENARFIFGGLIIGICEIFYAFRIYTLSRWRWLCCGIVFFALVQTGCLFATSIVASVIDTVGAFKILRPVTITWVSSIVIVDMFIVTSVLYYLQRTRNIISKDTSLCNRVSIVLLQTNFVTGIYVVITGVVLLSMHAKLWGPALTYSVAKLYHLSLMTSLNSRPSQTEATFTKTTATITTTFVPKAVLFPEEKVVANGQPQIDALTFLQENDKGQQKCLQRTQTHTKAQTEVSSPPPSAIIIDTRTDVSIDCSHHVEAHESRRQPKAYETLISQTLEPTS